MHAILMLLYTVGVVLLTAALALALVRWVIDRVATFSARYLWDRGVMLVEGRRGLRNRSWFSAKNGGPLPATWFAQAERRRFGPLEPI